MRTVFVDTSGFYALLDRTDPFHPLASEAFRRAEREAWHLVTTNYVVHESWALIQHRLGWDAVQDFLDVLLPSCRVQFIDPALHDLGANRCRQARRRHLSLTDCTSLEYMAQLGCRQAIARDAHFEREGVALP